MITANFYHLKNTNGMFYYGVDYLEKNIDIVRVIIVTKSIFSEVKKHFPDQKIVKCSFAQYLFQLFLMKVRGDLLFTPTTHPIPFINRQVVVIHDTYPFIGNGMGAFKVLLLKISLSMSCCKVAFINHSNARNFLINIGLQTGRIFFAPNSFPKPPKRISENELSLDSKLRIGLLGTDSNKKNYDCLFKVIISLGLSDKVEFRVYGHRTNYIENIIKEFHGLSVQLVKSDEESLDAFLGDVQVVVSASENEGFGRPIAHALLSGVAVKLLDKPVYREFFSGGASFYNDLESLVGSLVSGQRMTESKNYSPPESALDGFEDASTTIRLLATKA